MRSAAARCASPAGDHEPHPWKPTAPAPARPRPAAVHGLDRPRTISRCGWRCRQTTTPRTREQDREVRRVEAHAADRPPLGELRHVDGVTEQQPTATMIRNATPPPTSERGCRCRRSTPPFSTGRSHHAAIARWPESRASTPPPPSYTARRCRGGEDRDAERLPRVLDPWQHLQHDSENEKIRITSNGGCGKPRRTRG